ncbi:MAG TPA: DNA-3-methyladenine glycosylase I [Candidatus Limnocylindrales bacterium]|nr:DNA-3-methyladenine glycosylase I [Candidatus Limnocylindrales bacterium]
MDRDETSPGLVIGADGLARCWWCVGDDLYRRYHDEEWGRPQADERTLFEKISLEGFQSGLSWLTILRKRDSFRRAFAGFEPGRVARFTDDDVDRLMGDASIVRNRAKILATINNARRHPQLVDEFGSLARFLWSFEPSPDSRPALVDRATLTSVTTTTEAKQMSRELRRRGWSFVGPTTLYSAMQAMGVVNDHLDGCFTRPMVEAERAGFPRPTA